MPVSIKPVGANPAQQAQSVCKPTRGVSARISWYSSSFESGSRKFVSNCVFVYAGSMTETRIPRVRSS